MGSYAAKGFGLHDVCGNVFEWTRTSSGSLEEYPPRDVDGATESEGYMRVLRGGSYANPALSG